VVAQALAQPAFGRHIQHQAMAAGHTGAGVMHGCRDDCQAAFADPAAASGDLELQLATQAEHQLRVVVAVGNEVVLVVAQR